MQGGKRRRSAAKQAWWQRHVDKQASSGLSVREYCQQHQLSEHSFYGWRRELQLRANEPLAPHPTPAFTEVVLAPAPTTTPIEVRIGCQRFVVSPGFDPQTLTQVVYVLERGAC